MKQWTVDRREDCWCKVAPWSVTHIMSPFPLISIASSFTNKNVSLLLFCFQTKTCCQFLLHYLHFLTKSRWYLYKCVLFEHVSERANTALFVTRSFSSGFVAGFFWLPGGSLTQMANLSQGVIELPIPSLCAQPTQPIHLSNQKPS